MIKQWIHSLLRATGFDIVRYANVPRDPFSVLDYVISAQLTKSEHFYFVQIGANDGITFDPIHELIRRYKLPGLLVEPLPEVFQQLLSNYTELTELAFEQCAIAQYDGETRLYRPRPDAPLPKWNDCVSSMSRSHVLGHLGRTNRKHIEEVMVPCLTLSSLLKRHNVTDVTLLQIDVEGFDCEIVKMALESGLRPQIINYEYVAAPPVEQAACKRMLADSGYKFIDVGSDTLAIRQTVSGEADDQACFRQED
jgi:FkbM family methyltransferase